MSGEQEKAVCGAPPLSVGWLRGLHQLLLLPQGVAGLGPMGVPVLPFPKRQSHTHSPRRAVQNCVPPVLWVPPRREVGPRALPPPPTRGGGRVGAPAPTSQSSSKFWLSRKLAARFSFFSQAK